MRWTAVVNPGAGRRRRSRDIARLGDALAARAINIEVTESAQAGIVAGRRAFALGEGVLACGGDGTVRALAGLAAETGGLLGVVPLGAGNDFARALGVDARRPLAALDLLESGRETLVDLGRARAANGTTAWFSTVAHSGLDAEVNRWANTVKWASGTALYTVAALRSMALYQPTSMRVTVDGEVWAGCAWLVAVGNTHCYGGGMAIVPQARIDDGRLDVVLVSDVSRAQIVARFPQMIRGAHLGIDGIHTMSGTTVEIDGPGTQDLYASGERVGPLPAVMEVVPSVFRVLVPTGAPVGRITEP